MMPQTNTSSQTRAGNTTIKKLLYQFELSDNSVVITNHPNLQELSSNLNWQLHHHVLESTPAIPCLINLNYESKKKWIQHKGG